MPGYLINQYAMSEWQGDLRVASTSTTQASPTARATTQSGVYVLAQDGEHLNVAFAASHERWDETNFQRDPMQPWMAASDESVFLGMRIPGYNANWLRVLLNYSF